METIKNRRWAKSALNWSRAVGFDPRVGVRGAGDLKCYIEDARRFRAMGGSIDSFAPRLGERRDEAGGASGHYFWQDLIVAQRIVLARPARHLDLGSTIDGFVAHLLTTRQVDVVDIRKLTSNVPGLTYVQSDGTTLRGIPDRSVESLSSLHVMEHFGLGRYGDPLDPEGHIRGMKSAQRVLAPGGRLYLSFPVGVPRVEFNDHRVIDPCLPIEVMDELSLVSFSAIPSVGDPVLDVSPTDYRNNDSWCGLYEFARPYE